MAGIAERRGDPSARNWWCRALAASEAMQRAGTLEPAAAWAIEDYRGRLRD